MRVAIWVRQLVGNFWQFKKPLLLGFFLFLLLVGVPAFYRLLFPPSLNLPAESYVVLDKTSGKRFLSPTRESGLPEVLAATSEPKKVIGFLPFWNLDETANLRFKDLTLIYYFGVTVNPDGTFDKTEPGWNDMFTPEFATLRAMAKANGTKLGLTVLNMDQDGITAVISNPLRRQRVIDNTIKLMHDQGFSDVNIDFEYVGAASDTLSNNFSIFISDLSSALRQAVPGATLSVATLSDAAWKKRLTDIKVLSLYADNIIVMTYDFHRLDSQTAGPIAPLFGKERYEYDVYTAVTDYLRTMAGSKLVLGIPFYGYEWPTLSDAPDSFVLGAAVKGPEVSSYKRTLETLTKNNASVNFDDYSKSPWFAYYDKGTGTFRQVWFENERSLGLKLDLVNQAGLGGIAIWALGYDGAVNFASGDPLWQVVRDKLRS